MRILLLALFISLSANAAELRIESDRGIQDWSTDQLLAHPDARDIAIPRDVSYKRAMRYRAVPLAALLPGLKPDQQLQAVARDGFAAELPAAPLLQAQGAQAWLAIEEPARPWPALAKDKPSAGPFYLVWTDPAASGIGPEQWPFQVVKLRYLAPLAQRFPALLPAPEADATVQAGFAVFQKNCLACHRLNGAGDAAFGPDLNLPYNPTEYFAGDFLGRYIRDPQSLRRWPRASMPAFDRDVLSDEALRQLIAYLRHMAKRKV